MRLLTYEKNGAFGLAARRNDHFVNLGNISLLSALQEGSLPSLKKKIDSAPVLSEADIKIALPITVSGLTIGVFRGTPWELHLSGFAPLSSPS